MCPYSFIMMFTKKGWWPIRIVWKFFTQDVEAIARHVLSHKVACIARRTQGKKGET